MASPRTHRLSRALTVFAGLAIGVGLLVAFVLTREAPPRSEQSPDPTAVRFIQATPIHPVMEARGFGTVESARPWQAVANVAGRVVERHPALKNGQFVQAGTELLVIDPSRYQLALDQALADLQGIKAERRELEQEQANTRALLALEADRLELAEQELRRAQSLAERNMLSGTKLDAQKQTTIQQRQATQSLKNQLTQVPVKLEQLDARKAQAEARRDLAQEDLEDTRITAPFDLRIGRVEVETGEQVNRGQQVFQADGIDTAEVSLQIPFSHMRELVAQLSPDALSMGGVIPSTAALAHITAQIRVRQENPIIWTGRIVRVAEGIDPATRTLPVVVAVDGPYRNANPPQRPALVPGTFVEGVLSQKSNLPQLVVPAYAVHQGQIYLVDSEDRLRRRTVDVSRPQNGWVVVHEGLEAGERVIIDDVVPAIDGMPLTTRHDSDSQRALITQASGEQS
ncbi:efflux RND transporter periplasmic adaptor subunit [Guyparkeria sp. 1SP6A2]|nr:efflux RND transporter periplasmic adaptor subunit [Guyparkeria sp. 1SP6A2]